MKNYNEVFWGEVAPCDHLLQVYETDESFLDSLEGFTATGFLNGDAVVVIGTDVHINALEKRLAGHFDTASLKASGQFITRNAEEILEEFLVNDNIDEERFNSSVNAILDKARGGDRKVRVFGEIVAVLWGQGNRTATVQLESLWDKLCNSGVLCLFCAYPVTGFRQDIHDSIKEICSHHTKMINREELSTEVNLYGQKLSFVTLR